MAPPENCPPVAGTRAGGDSSGDSEDRPRDGEQVVLLNHVVWLSVMPADRCIRNELTRSVADYPHVRLAYTAGKHVVVGCKWLIRIYSECRVVPVPPDRFDIDCGTTVSQVNSSITTIGVDFGINCILDSERLGEREFSE